MRALVSLLVAVGCLLAVSAAPATAANYTVDSVLDEPDVTPGVGGCLTAGGKCTLRAAIEEANFSVGDEDTIGFSAAFDGKVDDVIVLGGGLPMIVDPVLIGSPTPCATDAGVSGPCAEVSGGPGLMVQADSVTIEGLAVTGALTGLNVIDESEGFAARSNWVGVGLDGLAGPNNVGIFIDPGSDGAIIGGTATSERNVVAANNNVGLDIEGASGATVVGNYFGVAPDGATAMPNPKNIELTDSIAGAASKPPTT